MKRQYDKETKKLIFRNLKFWRWNKTPYDKVKDVCPDGLPKQNIYDHTGTTDEYVSKHKRIHYRFKYNFFVPLMWLAKKVLGKSLEQEIPLKLPYKNLKIFEKAYLRSIDEWNELFRAYQGVKHFVPPPRGRIEQLKSQICNYFLTSILKIYLTVIKNDTSYLEFHNILMYNLAIDMNRNHKESAPHLFYHGQGINDVTYFIALPVVDGINLHKVGSSSSSEIERKDGLQQASN